MKPLPIALAAVTCGACLSLGGEQLIHSYKQIQLTGEFWSEGANFGDFNKDGENDIVSGPFWWQGPDFKKRHEYAPATQKFNRKNKDGQDETVHGVDPHGYSRNFLAFTHDINKDGYTDILILGFPGEESAWHENPKGREGHWQRHVILDVTDNESPTFTDITGDGVPEIVCASKGHYGYASIGSDPTKPWKFTNITPNNNYHKFTHGLGVGDVNGDGKMDLLEKDGWWEQPATLEGSPVWKHHKTSFGPGGAQMYAYDVDGDGDNDVITSLEAHGYGLAWFEHVKDGSNITFNQNLIIGKDPSDNKYGVKFSQMHGIDLVDMDADGIKDIITGKRWWAHGPGADPEPNNTPVTYFFKTTRAKGAVEFTPYLMSDNCGVGTQVVAGLINKDKLPDVVVGNKRGTYVLLHEGKKAATQEEWEKAQPKPLQKTAGK
ncbi:MAG: FG-GAP repeat domain-containing protein [Verrucomicrobiales bacterium]